MKKLLLAAVLSLLLGATAMAATPITPADPAIPGPAEQTVAQQNAALAPDTTLAPGATTTAPGATLAPAATTAPITTPGTTATLPRSDSRRAMEVIGVIIAIAVIVGIAAWAMRRRRTDTHYTTPNHVDDPTLPRNNVHNVNNVHNDRPVGIN